MSIESGADCSSGSVGTTKVCLAGRKSLTLCGSTSTISSTTNSGSDNNANSINVQPGDSGVNSIPSGGTMTSNNNPGLGTSTQNLAGSQVFGQNQHLTGLYNVQVGQPASNKQQNIDINTADGTALNTQTILGSNNQNVGQPQAISNSTHSGTQDSATIP